MKKILALVCALGIAAACAAPPPAGNTNTNANTSTTTAAPLTETEAVAKEKGVWDALRRKDYDAFNTMLSPDYVEVHSDAVFDKPGIVAYVRDLDLTEANFADVKFLPIDDDAALLTYNVTINGKYKGQDIPPGPYRVSSAWVNKDGKWLSAYYQETLASTGPPPPAPATSPAAATTASPAAPAVVPADPVEREKWVWGLLAKKDYATFATILDPQQLEVEAEGVMDRDATLKGVQSFDASGMTLSDFKTVNFDADSMLITYVVTDAKSKPPQSRHTSVWVKRGDKWNALMHHGTPMTAPGASPAVSPAASSATSPAAPSTAASPKSTPY